MWTVVALATTWWAEGPEQAGSVRAALDAGWPGHGIDVRVGPPGEGDAVWTEGSVLHARLGGDERRQEAADPQLQVVLVRSWTRDLVVEDAGWIPAVVPPDETLPELPPPPEPPEPPRPRAIGAIAGGTALRTNDLVGLAVGSAEGGVAVGNVGGIVRVEGNAFEETDRESFRYRTRSLAGSFGFVGWPARRPSLAWSLTVGFRAREHHVVWTAPNVDLGLTEWTTMHATTRLGARWTRPVGAARLGGAVSIEVDGPMEAQGELPEESGAWPVLAVAELVVERR